MQTKTAKIAAISGSLRTGSWARALVRAAAKRLPAGVDLTIWDGLEGIPPFNQDREDDPVHPAVAEMRELIAGCDVLLIVTPEYNHSMPGVLKNALDWASRPYGSCVLQGKPVAAVGTSPLPTGGASALSDLTRLLTAIRAELIETDLTVPLVHTRIDSKDQFCDAELAGRVDQLLAKVADRAVA